MIIFKNMLDISIIPYKAIILRVVEIKQNVHFKWNITYMEFNENVEIKYAVLRTFVSI